MYLVAIGGGEPKRRWHLLPFFILTQFAMRQARRASGCVSARVFERDGAYFSITVWDSPAAMKRYATTGAHAWAMKASPYLVAWFIFHHYQTEDTRPRIRDAYALWQGARRLRAAE